MILKLESVEGYLFVNDGDGEIYVNDVTYYDNDTKKIKIDYVNNVVKPGQFLEFRQKRKDLNGFVPLMADPGKWDQVYYALNKSFPGLSSEYSLANSTFLEIIEKAAHENPDNLVKTSGMATVNYYGLRQNVAQSHKIDVIGIVWKNKLLKSIPDKEGIDKQSNK